MCISWALKFILYGVELNAYPEVSQPKDGDRPRRESKKQTKKNNQKTSLKAARLIGICMPQTV